MAQQWIDDGIADMTDRLRSKAIGTGPDDLDPDDPFDLAFYRSQIAEAAAPILRQAYEAAGQLALRQTGSGLRFDMRAPRAERFLLNRTQRFAQEVSQVRWDRLKASLNAGVQAGEGIDELAARVAGGMQVTRTSAETIARTEVISAYNGGTLEGFQQSGIVASKIWLAALDDRTRDTHTALHGQTVPVDDDFSSISGAEGPAPGQLGTPEEDINCRCAMLAVLGENAPGAGGVVGTDAEEL